MLLDRDGRLVEGRNLQIPNPDADGSPAGSKLLGALPDHHPQVVDPEQVGAQGCQLMAHGKEEGTGGATPGSTVWRNAAG